MIWWVGLLGLALGAVLGYGIAYARFGNASIVSELRDQHRELLKEYQEMSHELNEYEEQNRIIKYKAQQLLQQNEDYAKIVSQLSRYHYHLQQAAEKVQELNEIVGIHDDDLEKKLMAVESQQPVSNEDFDSGNEDLMGEDKKEFF